MSHGETFGVNKKQKKISSLPLEITWWSSSAEHLGGKEKEKDRWS